MFLFKNIVSSQYKPPPHSQSVLTPANEATPSQPASVGVTSSVIEEYDPARPNDYEEHKREKKRETMEAEMKRELEKRRQEEEEREEREKEKRKRSRLNISGEEALTGGGGSGNVDGFSIGKSETSGFRSWGLVGR